MGLRAAFFGAAGAGTASGLAHAMEGGGADPGRVAIIGAGIAGLRCAHRLYLYSGTTSKRCASSKRKRPGLLARGSF
jgi:monoamine oxidase